MKEAIIVLGGGIKDAKALSASTQSRLDVALNLYSGQKIMVVGAGPTKSPPPLDARGFPVFESVGAVRYLLEHGIPTDQVLYETSSYDTIGNGYFSRFIHVDPAEFTDLTIITSAFHMPRTKIIFNWIYGLDPKTAYHLDYANAPDDHFSTERMEAHTVKEQRRIADLKLLIEKIQNISALHQWMFTQHAAYCAHLQPVEISSSPEEKGLLAND